MRRHLIALVSASLMLLAGCSAAEETAEPTSASSLLAQEPGAPVTLEQVEEPVGLVRVEDADYYVTEASDGLYFVSAEGADCGYAPTGAKWDESGSLAVSAVELTTCLTGESFWRAQLPDDVGVPRDYDSYVTVDKLERVRTT